MIESDLSKCALVIAGHGSTENPDSSVPYMEHAEEIRRRNIFAEVHTAFWKEEPSFRDAWYMTDRRDIFVVPDFISEGYFTQEVIPRELEIKDASTNVRGKNIHYCSPVGVHPSMTSLLLKRAKEVAHDVPSHECTLIIVGHGTGLNQNSTKAIKDQCTILREQTEYPFADVLDAYMEEQPFIADWHEMAKTQYVIVVPFFIADGLHSYQDIPVLLGMEKEVGAAASQREVFRHNPHHLKGKTLYYSSAIGTEKNIADVILDQVYDFIAKEKLLLESHPLTPRSVSLSLTKIGQVAILPINQKIILCHADDAELVIAHNGEPPNFRIENNPYTARDLTTWSDDGEYRFLKAAPNLAKNWLLICDDETALYTAIENIYPAALSLQKAHAEGTLQIQSLRDKLARQTGMYRYAQLISDASALEVVRSVCDPKNCAKKILWSLDEKTNLLDRNCDSSLLCHEPCLHLISKCRSRAKQDAK